MCYGEATVVSCPGEGTFSGSGFTVLPMSADDRDLSPAEAYEAAYRLVGQYAEREPSSEALQLLLVSMEPPDDEYRTNDPASWSDWLGCVADVGADASAALPGPGATAPVSTPSPA